MTTRHILDELSDDVGSGTGYWFARCSCGWTNYYVSDALTAARSFDQHVEQARDDRYTWSQMEQEWQSGYDEGLSVGYDVGWEEGREELIDDLNKLKEAADAERSPATSS